MIIQLTETAAVIGISSEHDKCPLCGERVKVMKLDDGKRQVRCPLCGLSGQVAQDVRVSIFFWDHLVTMLLGVK